MTFIAFNMYSANSVKLIYRSFLWAKSQSKQSRGLGEGLFLFLGYTCDKGLQLFLVLIPGWNLWENSIWVNWGSLFFTSSTLRQAHGHLNQNQMSLSGLKITNCRLRSCQWQTTSARGYKTHSTREILVRCILMLSRSWARFLLIWGGVRQFCKTFLHSKPVIWDCLSENQRLLCSQIPPPPPLGWQRLVFSSLALAMDGLFWQRQQVPSQAPRAGVSAETQGLGWPASHLHFPCVSWYTCHPHSERF